MQLIRITVAVMICLLSACSSVPQGPTGPVNLPAQLAQLATVKHWEIKGKMAIKDPSQSLSANIVWRVQEPDFSFRMTNFLGVTLVDLSAQEGLATLKADNETYTDSNAAALIYQVTGWDIPLQPLLGWIKGLPREDDSYQLNDSGLLTQLTPSCFSCGNWQISYSQYRQVNDIWLPHSIVLTDTSSTNHWIKIRVNSWTL